MAMVKPIANSLSAFDATNNQTFSFTSTGGNQVVKNKIVIKDNTTSDIVYENTVVQYVFSQTVPAGTLTNGGYYSFYFITYDVYDNESAPSNIVSFYCFTTPELIISNMPSGNIINSYNFTFEATYSQVENERLSFLYFTLYDATGTQIAQSSNIYDSTAQPTTVEYYYNGFEENSNYQIRVDGETQHGTIITTGLINFTTSYYSPTLFVDLDLQNRCDDGYVQITSNLIAIDGVSNPIPPNYTDGDTTATVFENTGEYIYWDEGYSISSDFLFRLWFRPCGEIQEIAELRNWKYGYIAPSNAISFKFYLMREIPDGETEPKTCVRMESTQEVGKQVTLYSNYIDLVNNLSEIFIWFKKVGDTYELQIELLNTKVQNEIEWNGLSNVEENKITDILYVGESYPQGAPHSNTIDSYDDFMLDTILLQNGVYDNIDVTEDTSLTFTTEKPDWTNGTVMNCDFEGNISAGNVEGLASDIAQLKLKRRKFGSTDEITLCSIDIASSSDLSFTRIDSFCASGETYEYFIVPVLSDGTEGSYVTNTIDTYFNGLFISNLNNIFKLYENVSYSGFESVQLTGYVNPIGRKYPIIRTNSATDYEKGTIGGKLLGQTFGDTRTINRKEVVNQINNWNEFLKNNDTAKIIKDWNGNIWVVRIVNNIPRTYANTYGQGIADISFNWIEQGKYDNQSDMYENGLIDETC